MPIYKNFTVIFSFILSGIKLKWIWFKGLSQDVACCHGDTIWLWIRPADGSMDPSIFFPSRSSAAKKVIHPAMDASGVKRRPEAVKSFFFFLKKKIRNLRHTAECHFRIPDVSALFCLLGSCHSMFIGCCGCEGERNLINMKKSWISALPAEAIASGSWRLRIFFSSPSLHLLRLAVNGWRPQMVRTFPSPRNLVPGGRKTAVNENVWRHHVTSGPFMKMAFHWANRPSRRQAEALGNWLIPAVSWPTEATTWHDRIAPFDWLRID